jgi:probable rRNA maturation factor
MIPLDAEIELQIEPDVAVRMGPVALDDDRLVDLVHFTLESEDVTGSWSIAIVLTSDDHLRRLHDQFMGIDEETDVMTFPYEPDPTDPNAPPQGGDIVISVDRASDNANTFDLTPSQEISFLAVHGTLHLCGWNDLDPLDRELMLIRQRLIIDAFETAAR